MTNDLQGIELTDDETRGAGARSTSIGLHAVKLADARVAATGILDKLAEWRAADRDPRAAGGHTVTINDRHILVALYLRATTATSNATSPLTQRRCSAPAAITRSCSSGGCKNRP